MNSKDSIIDSENTAAETTKEIKKVSAEIEILEVFTVENVLKASSYLFLCIGLSILLGLILGAVEGLHKYLSAYSWTILILLLVYAPACTAVGILGLTSLQNKQKNHLQYYLLGVFTLAFLNLSLLCINFLRALNIATTNPYTSNKYHIIHEWSYRTRALWTCIVWNSLCLILSSLFHYILLYFALKLYKSSTSRLLQVVNP